MNRIFQKIPSVQKMKMTAADPNGPQRRGFRVCLSVTRAKGLQEHSFRERWGNVETRYKDSSEVRLLYILSNIGGK